MLVFIVLPFHMTLKVLFPANQNRMNEFSVIELFFPPCFANIQPTYNW